MRHLLDHGGVEVVLQPLVELGPQRIVGWEALLRGRDAAGGVIAPLEVVDSATRVGMLDELTRVVTEQAVQAVAQAAALTRRPLGLSVNVEVAQLHEDSSFLRWIRARRQTPGVRLVLEIAERGEVAWTPERVRLADELAGSGIELAIDDLGAGHSRIQLLRQRRWHWVKLDQGFLDPAPLGDQVLTQTVNMLHALGAQVVQEGIERPDQLDLARRLGVRLGQGNLLGLPLSPSEMLAGVRAGGLHAGE